MKITETQLRARYKKWTDALRSGKYKQNIGCLKDVKGYCCLGVLVDLGDNVKRTEKGWISGYQLHCYGKAAPWEAVVDAMYLAGEVWDLVQKNDSGATFKEIADYIEQVVLPNALRRLENQQD